MRHPNRRKTIEADGRMRSRASETGTEHARSERSKTAAHARRRKWMQNFSLQAGPPLWVLLKRG